MLEAEVAGAMAALPERAAQEAAVMEQMAQAREALQLPIQAEVVVEVVARLHQAEVMVAPAAQAS
jgi:hypothetical protein